MEGSIDDSVGEGDYCCGDEVIDAVVVDQSFLFCFLYGLEKKFIFLENQKLKKIFSSEKKLFQSRNIHFANIWAVARTGFEVMIRETEKNIQV